MGWERAEATSEHRRVRGKGRGGAKSGLRPGLSGGFESRVEECDGRGHEGRKKRELERREIEREGRRPNPTEMIKMAEGLIILDEKHESSCFNSHVN